MARPPTKRPVALVLATVFFFSLVLGCVNYSMIFYLKDLFHADKGVIGLTAAGQVLTQMTAMLLLLRWRTAPFRTLVLCALGWAPVCLAVYLVFPVMGVTMAFHGLLGLASACFWPRVAGWLSAGREGQDLSRIMGRFNLAWSTGGLAAPTLGGLLLAVDLRLPFLGASVLLAVFFVLNALRLGQDAASAPAAGLAETPGTVKTPLRVPGRLGMVSVSFLIGILMNIYPAYARDTFGLSEAVIGTFLLVRMVLNTGGFLLWGRTSFWHFQPWVLPGVQVVLIGLAVAYPLAGQPWMVFVLFALMGIVYSFQYSYSQFHSTAGAADRTRGTTIHEVVLNIGFILGTAAGGWIAEAWSMETAFAVAAWFALAIGAVQLVLLGPRLAGGKAFCLTEAGQSPRVLR